MRKLHYILAGLVLTTVLVSCEKQNKHDIDIDVMKAAKISAQDFDLGPNIPVSDGQITPEVILGENNGGNRTCVEVYEWFAPDALCGEDFLCGDKVDYDEDGEGFGNGFDHYAGLEVTVNGIYISFEVTDCIEIDGAFYKVGAVIVKGSNAANVYFYPDGTTGDAGLAAPGNKHMVSNLTFCFVPCEPENWVIAFKSLANNGSESVAVYTPQTYRIPDVSNSIRYELLGYGTPFNIIRSDTEDVIATITATEVEHEGTPHIRVVVDADGWDFINPYLYVGSESGIAGLWYTSFPFDSDDVVATPCEFLIPVADISW